MLGSPEPLAASVVPDCLFAAVAADVTALGCLEEVDAAVALGISPLNEETELDGSFMPLALILLLYVW
jgi:hypothetical protein